MSDGDSEQRNCRGCEVRIMSAVIIFTFYVLISEKVSVTVKVCVSEDGS